MDIKFPARDRLNQNKEDFKNGLNEQLRIIDEIKSDLVKMQKYELTAYYRDIEKLLEKCVSELNKIEESTTHNNGNCCTTSKIISISNIPAKTNLF